ncbi:MAG: UDP-N-acetylglucosamine pyrophosphorylase [Parasporobacterium sp.]|nr:UDP-N-acetylglucosamine pyrophosphorylase [Parasporobacterium sp.]
MGIKIKDLYDLEHTRAAEYLNGFTYPWEALAGISDFIKELGKTLPADEFDHPEEDVWIAKDVVFYNRVTNYIKGPVIIGHGTEVRPGAFIRGSALVGDNCVVGNSTELKNVILFDNVQVPHYNYVGDSILGYKAHMGAGSITSNVKSDKKNVVIKYGDEEFATDRKKVGAMLGDRVEVGCNSVLNPGTIVGRDSNVYPTSGVRGVIAEDSIYKDAGVIVSKK